MSFHMKAATQLDNYSTASPQYDSVSSDESSVHNATSLECPREDEIKLTTVVRKSASISFSEKTNSPEMEVKTVSEETTDDDGATVLPDRVSVYNKLWFFHCYYWIWLMMMYHRRKLIV